MRIGWGVEGFGWVEDGSLERGGGYYAQMAAGVEKGDL